MKNALISIIVLTVGLLPVSAETLHVPADYNTIQSAIDATQNGDTVLIAPGRYTGDGNRDISFLGKAITVRSIDPNDPDIVASTIIDCNGSPDDPHRGFYFHSGEDANSVLSGLTITNGYAPGDYRYGRGGAIFCEGTSPLISHCAIARNTADSGGGIYCLDSSPTIQGCKLVNNEAHYSGGGMSCRGGNLEITHCLIFGNSAVWEGGGMDLVPKGFCTITNCVIICNRSGATAAISFGMTQAALPCEGILANCTIADNVCTNPYPFSGPIYFDSKQSEITNCIIWNNSPPEMSAPSVLVTYSDIQGGWEGQGNIDIDPRFAFEGDYHLSRGSPCIDAGTNDPCGGLGVTDIDGAARIIDGDGDGVLRIDMGAYEHNPTIPVLHVSSPSPLVFHYAQGYKIPEAKSLSIANAAGGTLDWKIIEDCNWLRIHPTEGQTTTQTNQVAVSVDPLSLEPGKYKCELQVVAYNALNSPVIIEVILLVGRLLRVPSEHGTIQAAVDDANDYDTVIVAPGAYTGSGNRDIDLREKAITVRSIDPLDPCCVAATIIDCGGTQNQPHRAFVLTKGQEIGPAIDGLSIVHGYHESGGAVYCSQSSLEVVRHASRVNAGSERGALYVCDSPIRIANCLFSANTARNGGAIYCYGCDLRMSRCTFSDNVAEYWGGAVYCEFREHGIPNRSQLSYCLFEMNTAELGGAVCAFGRGDRLVFDNCLFTENSGGAVYFNQLAAMFSNTVFRYNSAGGAVYGWSHYNVSFQNCILTGNSAYHGGGAVFVFGSDKYPTFKNCTIVGNSAGHFGVVTAKEISNSVIQGNRASHGPQVMEATVIAFCNVEGGWPGEGNIDADPCFVQAGYWGDVNDANFVLEPNHPDAVWVDGDYRLLADSPCIDAGEPNYVASPDETDLDGRLRVVDGDGDGLPRVDMGAFEYVPPIEAEIRITPRVLNLKSNGNWILCKITLPEDYNATDIDRGSILLEGQIEPRWVFASEKLQAAIAMFSRGELLDILAPGRAEVLVTGELTDGTAFEGTDVIFVIDPPAHRRTHRKGK